MYDYIELERFSGLAVTWYGGTNERVYESHTNTIFVDG